jgi:hypothetical protein
MIVVVMVLCCEITEVEGNCKADKGGFRSTSVLKVYKSFGECQRAEKYMDKTLAMSSHIQGKKRKPNPKRRVLPKPNKNQNQNENISNLSKFNDEL